MYNLNIVCNYVQQVFLGSKAEKLGLRRGDMIVSTSATAGDNMWSHDSVESVRSALSTRSAYTHTYIHTFLRKLSTYITLYLLTPI